MYFLLCFISTTINMLYYSLGGWAIYEAIYSFGFVFIYSRIDSLSFMKT